MYLIVCLCERDEGRLNRVQRRVTEMTEDMVESKSYENSLEELGMPGSRSNLPDAVI